MEIVISIIGGLLAVIGGLFWALVRANDDRREQGRDLKAHERMNDADLGIGATDADNADWLRDFSKRHRR